MSTDKTKADIESQLWSEIKKGRYGMLGLVGERQAQHFQPMTAFCEPATGEIGFFTRKDTDLAQAVSQGGEAMFVVRSKDQDFQACVGGRLEQDLDRSHLDEYWNPVVSAWFPKGKDNPDLTMLRLDARDAQVWVSDAGPIKFAWEIAKANATHQTPDVGVSQTLKLNSFGLCDRRDRIEPISPVSSMPSKPDKL